MKENKIKYGLENVHYSLITENPDGEISYGIPKKWVGAVNFSAKANVVRTPVPADNNPEYAVISENNGYDIELEVQEMYDEIRVDILGATIDSNGCLVENKDDKASPFALLFEFKGDKKATRRVMYNCLATKPDMESSTTGDKTEAKTDKISITCKPAKDTGDVSYKTGIDTPTSVYNSWYKKVHLKSNSGKTNISPDVVTFDKKSSNQSDIVVNILKVDNETLSGIKNGDTPLITTTNFTQTGNVITIKKDYLSTLDNGEHYLTMTFSNGSVKTLTVKVVTSA